MRFFDDDLTALVRRLTEAAVGTEDCSKLSQYLKFNEGRSRDRSSTHDHCKKKKTSPFYIFGTQIYINSASDCW